MRQSGFTLIEILVALSIFGILLTASLRAFAQGFKLQRQALEMQDLQKDASLMLEVMSRELRMSRSVENISTASLNFTNSDGDAMTFCRGVKITGGGQCQSGGNQLVMRLNSNSSLLNSANVQVDNLSFHSFGDRYFFISLKLKTAHSSATFQTGVVPRSAEL